MRFLFVNYHYLDPLIQASLDPNSMLQSIRDNAQGIVSKILVSLIAFTFVIWGAESLFDFSGGSDAPATVNGEDISMQALAQAAEIQRRQVLLNNPDIDPATLDMQAIQASTLEQLINEEILLQYAADNGMAISANAVNQMIVESDDFKVDGKFDLQRFEMLIANVGLTATVYKQQLVKNNLINQMQQGVTASAFTLDADAARVVALDSQTRSFDALTLPFAKQLAGTVIDDQAVAAHFEANSADYLTPEQVQVNYVLLEKASFAEQVNITDAQLEDAYAQAKAAHVAEEEREAAHILFNVDAEQSQEQAMAKAQQAYAKLQAGTDFAAVAAEFSEDTGSAEDGGSLGAVLAGDFGGEFDEVLFALQSGQYSEPVATQFGVQIIKLEGVVDNAFPSFDEQRASLLEELQLQGAEGLFVAASETMADIAFSSPDLQEVSDELGLAIQQSEWFGRDGASQFGELANRVATAAFSTDVLEQGNNSEVIELASDKLMVMSLKGHNPAAAQALADVADAIRLQLQQQQALTDLQAKAEELVASLQQGANADDVAASLGLTWQAHDKAPRMSNAVSPVLSQAAFKLAYPAETATFGSATDFTGDVSVLRLRAVHNGDINELTAEQQAGLHSALSRMQGQAETIAFEAGVNAKAEVERL